MSPHLLFLLTAQLTHRPFRCERDRNDAQLAAMRMGMPHAAPAPVELLAI
jgi:hypothetical protein